VYFVPIRHHSPGCSAALRALLAEVRPATVLIEGPREYAALLLALADERTKPPIAVLSIREGHTGYYPLADFSPEWVALRWGVANDAVVDFIDQSWADRPEPEDAGAGVRTLQAEAQYVHSEAIAALAARLGCRDHDEVWEHLFELRDDFSNWRQYQADVLAWAGLARLEADQEVLNADGTHAREAVMAAVIERHRSGEAGPMVVVTGAYHTLALLEALDDTAEGRWVTGHDPGPLDVTRPAWLIRYDHTRLDGLRGYGAGMPAPGFWQRVADASPVDLTGGYFVVGLLLEVADRLRADGELLATPEVTAAAEQALRLAQFRGRAFPGRTDVIDAMLSCFVRDDSGLTGALGEAINAVFGGTTLGDLPPGIAAPPLVAEARAQAARLRFSITDGATREVSLDTARKPAHARRREFLATMRFIGSGFARQIGGADLVTGTGLGQLAERWEYAWTPLVEAALIATSEEGATIAQVRGSRIANRLSAESLTAEAVATLIAELVVMGALDELPQALAALRTCYDAEARLAAIVASLHILAGLIAETGRLALNADRHLAELRELLTSGLAAAAYQLGPLAGIDPADEGEACQALLSLRSLLRRLGEMMLDIDTGPTARELRLLRQRRAAPARLRGVLVGIGHSDGDLAPGDLHAEVAAHLSPGVDPERVAGFLLGLMQAVPDLILHDPELLAAVSAQLSNLGDEAFLAMLPDLRQAFTWLRPTETARLAELIAKATGLRPTDLDAVLNVSPALAVQAQKAEQALLASLAQDGLNPSG